MMAATDAAVATSRPRERSQACTRSRTCGESARPPRSSDSPAKSATSNHCTVRTGSRPAPAATRLASAHTPMKMLVRPRMRQVVVRSCRVCVRHWRSEEKMQREAIAHPHATARNATALSVTNQHGTGAAATGVRIFPHEAAIGSRCSPGTAAFTATPLAHASAQAKAPATKATVRFAVGIRPRSTTKKPGMAKRLRSMPSGDREKTITPATATDMQTSPVMSTGASVRARTRAATRRAWLKRP
mmetsp:Transcript_26639/g.78404  ORF Transcript_26639/g.78404 Transcript_26639/m.78404 type:complete len:244 (-) Transcript_26639:361-1092(-)